MPCHAVPSALVEIPVVRFFLPLSVQSIDGCDLFRMCVCTPYIHKETRRANQSKYVRQTKLAKCPQPCMYRSSDDRSVEGEGRLMRKSKGRERKERKGKRREGKKEMPWKVVS